MIEWCGWLIVSPPLIKEIKLAVPPVALPPGSCVLNPESDQEAVEQDAHGQDAKQELGHVTIRVWKFGSDSSSAWISGPKPVASSSSLSPSSLGVWRF